MTRIYLADSQEEERLALRLMALDLRMEVAGEGVSLEDVRQEASSDPPNILLIEYALLPEKTAKALVDLRDIFPQAAIVLLINRLDPHLPASLSGEADQFISKGDTPERVADILRKAAARSG